MGSITGLKTGNFTSINNSGQIRLGDQLNAGTSGQALISRGPDEAATWDIHTGVINPLTMGTDLSLASGNATFDGSIADTINAAGHGFGTGGNGIDITGTTITTDNDNTTITNALSGQNQVLKVPNALTAGTDIGFSVGTTYDGSSAITISSTATDTQLNLTAALPIVINDLGGLNREVDIDIDSNTMGVSGGELEVIKVPNTLTASTNIIFTNTDDGSLETSYDGSQPITIRATDTNTQYTAGTNLNLSITTFNLDTSISGMINISFLNDGTSTSITGSSYPGKPTTATNLDLTDTSNIISPYCFHNVYGTASTDFDSLTTSYGAGSILGALGASIVAKQTALCIELIVYNYAISSNRDTDMRLVDKAGSEWSVGTSEGGSGTGTIQTAREVHRADETDRQIVHQTWSITGLTIGSTYTFNPQARTSSTTNYLAAGGSYPDAFFRGYYLPATGI